MLTAVGEDLTLYSVHSLRAGGVTDLFLSGVIPVQIYGRWKFESALIYFRDASGIMAYVAAKALETEVFSCIGDNDHWPYEMLGSSILKGLGSTKRDENRGGTAGNLLMLNYIMFPQFIGNAQ